MAATNSKLRLVLRILAVFMTIWYFAMFVVSIVALASIRGYFLIGVMMLLLTCFGLACGVFGIIGAGYHPVTKRGSLIYMVITFIGYLGIIGSFSILACLSWGLVPTVDSTILLSTNDFKKSFPGCNDATIKNPLKLLATAKKMMSLVAVMCVLSVILTAIYLLVFTIHMSFSFSRRYWIFGLGGWMLLTGIMIAISTKYINPYKQKIDGKNLKPAALTTFYIIFGVALMVIGICLVFVGLLHRIMKKLVPIAKIVGAVMMVLFAILFFLAISMNKASQKQMGNFCESDTKTCLKELTSLKDRMCHDAKNQDECMQAVEVDDLITLRKSRVQGWCATIAAVSIFVILYMATVFLVNLGEEKKTERPLPGSSAYAHSEVAVA